MSDRTTVGGITLTPPQQRDVTGTLLAALADISMLTHGELSVNASGSGTTDLTAEQTRAAIIRLTGTPSAGRILRFNTNQGARVLAFANETATAVVVRTTAETTGGVIVPPSCLARVVVKSGVALGVSPPAKFALLGGNPAALVTNSAAQSIPSGAGWVKLVYNTEPLDNDSVHDATNPTRLTCATAGLYIAGLCFIFPPNTVGNRFGQITLNNTATLAEASVPSLGATHNVRILVVALVSLAVGDYLESAAFQDSGVSLSVPADTTGTPCKFWMVRLS